MTSRVRHVAELIDYLAKRRRYEREDADALRHLESVPLELPAGLTVDWLGVAGYRFTYQDHTLFVDPFVSRVPLSALLRRRTALPDPARVAAVEAPGTTVGILIGHGHWDHALDAPALARRLGCRVYGSRSVENLMRLHGLDDSAVEVEPYHRYELGPFTVSFTPSTHSKLVLGQRIPFDGDTSCDTLAELTPQAYRCGQTWGITITVGDFTIYHQGSADLIDDAVREHDVDLFLAGVAGRSYTPDYWQRVLSLLRPKVVVPTHYDDFFVSVDDPMAFTTLTRLANVPDELHAVSRDLGIAALPRVTR
ncbi:L-ascorbate metabolism protein UlaG (beta-lactamase superfamily) [Herbihabitans rhizosphaerae]|uniref:L-ascorbate metabolism protein UlaG (Beta-lactamase superfamily) n=1 Tax=Herbihabitans rhizosphaerae TaxID=1872711 RepID=A0A4Q7KBP5_9PSEU|nr:MBL fold metallo-hydrolase [Herbihabitans rhizosphaerae]RZS29783.1 L-ascorbate metabolism protein UlaG (beta-lactamase superfamily) [Herbihabitans rhizosphaerae]